MKTLKLESKMNKKPSQSIDQAISALVDHNIKKSFKASDTNDDNNFDPLNLTIESAMALLDRHYRLDKSAYISIRSKLKDKIVKNGIRQSKILYKEADKEFNRLVGRAPVRYVAPRPARLSPIESAQASVRSLRETESKLRISLSHLKPGTSEYNDAHEHLVRILSQLKAAENPLSAFYEGYAFGSQDLEGSQPKNESDSARRSRLEGIFPSLKKRVEAEQLNFFHLVGLIANAEKRIQRLQDLYHHGHGDDKALIQENNSLVERLHMLLVNYQNSMREMPGHIKRLNEVAKALNEYYQDDENHANPGLDWGLIALSDLMKLGADGKIKSPGQLALRFGNLIGDISQLPTVIASLPNLKIREMSNALSQGLTGEPIADSIYQDPIVQATQQVGVMGAYLIPGVGEVLSLASLLSLKQAMERDPIGTFREVYDSFNPLANKIHDPETGNLRGATPADRIVRGLNLLILAVGAYHLKGGLTMDGLAKALGNEYHISFAEGKKFVEDLNADLLKVRVEEEARQQLKANAKKGNFKSVDDYLEAHPNALKKTIAEIEKSPNLMKKLSLPQQIEQLGNAKGVKERIEKARNAPPDRGSDGENRLGGAVSTMGGNGPAGGEGLTGAGGTPTSKSTKSAASSVVQGPKSGSGVAVAVRGTETAKAQGASSTAEASANKKAGPFERVWVEEAGTNAINGGSVPKFDVSAIQDGGTWLHESPFRKSSPFELPQPNGKPSGITFELGKDGHNLTLSDGSSFTITKPLWQSFLEQGTQPFGSSLFGIGRGFTNPAQTGVNSQSFSLGTPSGVRRFSELGDPTKSGSGSGQPAVAGGTSANGQAGTAVQPQANSGAVASSGPAATPKSGLDKNAAVALIGGNQGGAGQSTTIGDPTTNPTSPPPTDPMNPTTPAKPGVQGINEMETPKGDIYDTSHPGWRNRTKQWIDTIQRSLDAGFFPEAYASQMRQYLEQLKLSVINGKPVEEIEDQYSNEEVERNINDYRRKMGFKLLPSGWWDVQNEIIRELETQSKDPNPTISERAKKDLEEVMSYRSRWRVDHLTEKRIFQNLYKEAPQDAGLFDDPEALDLPESKDPVFKYALKPADGSLFVSFRPDSFEAVKTDFKNIDLWKEKFPDSIGQWDESMAAIFQPHDKVFGRKNIPAGEHSYVPIAPAKLLEYIQNPSVLGHALTLVSADMRDAATNGLMHMKMTRGLYDQGKMTAGKTGEFIAWGMLSKRLTPYYQEAGFMILREKGLKSWIQSAADGEFSEAEFNDYCDWVERTLKGTPGASAIANAKAFGRDFLLKGAQVLREGPYAGKTAIQAIHEIVANPNLSGPQMRRLIGEINYPLRLGFDNKITSFFLQLTGKTDVMVLDRVQFNHFWNSTELAPQLGIKTKKGSATANLYDNTNLASIANGPRGIAVYEAMESALSQPVLDAYRRLGIEDGNLSRFHWETWSLHSGQATDHSTLNLITNDLLGLQNNGIGARQGKFDTWGSQSTFGYGQGGAFGKFTWSLSDGTSIELESEQQQRLIEELRRQQEGRGRSQYVVVPKGFKLANLDEKGAKIPWFQAKGVNRQNLDMLIRSVAK